MTDPARWSAAFARQARAEWQARETLLRSEGPADCVCHHLLQMACEKLCKAHQLREGTPLATLESSHRWVAKTLPSLARQYWIALGARTRGSIRDVERALRQLGGEIDALAPRADGTGGRPDNSEYPWDDGTGKVIAPVDFAFPNLHPLSERAGTLLLKLVPAALADLVSPEESDASTDS